MTVTERLKDIWERVEAATAGPWELIGGGEYVTGVAILVAPDDGGVTGNDAEFIAHARTDLPRLLAAVERVIAICESDGWAEPESEFPVWAVNADDITEAVAEALAGK